MPKVSIITASYNYENYIKETIESVLNQTYPDWEMIIVDDGSKDNSVEVIKSYCLKDERIKLYCHENGANKGLIETIKLALSKVNGEWVAFVESDDTIEPDYLEKKLKIAEKYPNVNFIFNDVNLIGDESRIKSISDSYFKGHYELINTLAFPSNVSKFFRKTNLVPTFSAAMLRYKILDNVDFDCAVPTFLDWYLWSQLSYDNEFYYLDEKLSNWRMHKDSYATKKIDYVKNCFFFKAQLRDNTCGGKFKLWHRIQFGFIILRRYLFCIHAREKEIIILTKKFSYKNNVLARLFSIKKHENQRILNICGLKIKFSKKYHKKKTKEQQKKEIEQIKNSIFFDYDWYIKKYNHNFTKDEAVEYWYKKGWLKDESPSEHFDLGYIKFCQKLGENPIIQYTGRGKRGFPNNRNTFKSDDDAKRINDYLEYKKTRKSKSVVYTCITNDYDNLEEIACYKYIDKDWDYICFTDNKEHLNKGQIGIFETRPLVYTEMDNTRNSRFHKLNPHLVLGEYDESLFIDSNINILSSFLFDFIKSKNQNIILPKHFKNTCIFEEYENVKEGNLDNINTIEKERQVLIENNMPKNYGMCENNIIYRKHNQPEIIKIDEMWWDMVVNYSKRDQLSLCYVLFKNNISPKDITFENSRFLTNDFYVFDHSKKRKRDTILITGGAGFIGSTLADKLIKQDREVIVVDNFNDYYDPEIKENNVSSNLNNPQYKLYRGDICDRELMKTIFTENKIDTVIHIAAKAGVRPSLEDPLSYVRVNIEGTVNILEQMRINDVKKIVFASSSSVYGNCKADKFSEDLKVNEPISPYAATKSSCEQFIYTYSKLYSINAVCLRFFTVYGPKQRPDLAIRKFVELIQQDKEIPVYGDGTTKRDYTYIDDIVNGIICAINYNKTPYEIINLGGGGSVTLNKMIQTIEKALNKKAKIKRLPMQKGDVNKTASNIKKAKKLLGYSPKTSFSEGIKKFIEWKNSKKTAAERKENEQNTVSSCK